MPNVEAGEVTRTTDQADMNISSGKRGIRKLVAWSSLSKVFKEEDSDDDHSSDDSDDYCWARLEQILEM